MTLGYVETIEPTYGSIDTIDSGNGRDIILAGAAGDIVTAGDGNNLIFGDHGYIDFVTADSDASDIDDIQSTATGIGGSDTITTGVGNDIVIGGPSADGITVNDGANLVFGDNGRIRSSLMVNSLAAELATNDFSITLGYIETVDSQYGEIDTITSGIWRDIILAGAGGDGVNAGDGNNLIFGDHGFIDYVTEDLDASDIDRIWSKDTAIGGADSIETGVGNDILIGGPFADSIKSSDGSNLVLGDNGKINSSFAVNDSNEVVSPSLNIFNIAIGMIETVDAEIGGIDTITSGIGCDIILAGVASDDVNASTGSNIVFGDHGFIDYVTEDTDASDIDRIWSTDTAIGGDDTITTGVDNDIVIGGPFADMITAGDGANLILGDNGYIYSPEAYNDSDDLLASYNDFNMTLGYIKTVDAAIGGIDRITTGVGRDIILAGALGDQVIANCGETTSLPDARNLIFGDHGYIDYVTADGDATDFDDIQSTDTGTGGEDSITTGVDNDIAIGGPFADCITISDGANLILGDNGRIRASLMVSALATELLTDNDFNMTLGYIETIAPLIGDMDVITSGIDRDIILGGTADDTITANFGETVLRPDSRNLIFGDHGYIDYVTADSDASDIDIIKSTDTGMGGDDTITTGVGNDIIIGGPFEDRITAGDGANILFGDNGQILSSWAANSTS
ncbi:MAG TPA: hypothetical protein VII92_14330, partial [Anaerolineae bacterium]